MISLATLFNNTPPPSSPSSEATVVETPTASTQKTSEVIKSLTPSKTPAADRKAREEKIQFSVYVIPPENRNGERRLLSHRATGGANSVGIIRISPTASLSDVRVAIQAQLQSNPDSGPFQNLLIPLNFVFMRTIGKSLAQVKQAQESQMQAAMFLQPQPALYLMEPFRKGADSDIASTTTLSKASTVSSSRSSRLRPETQDSGSNTAVSFIKSRKKASGIKDKHRPLPEVPDSPESIEPELTNILRSGKERPPRRTDASSPPQHSREDTEDSGFAANNSDGEDIVFEENILRLQTGHGERPDSKEVRFLEVRNRRIRELNEDELGSPRRSGSPTQAGGSEYSTQTPSAGLQPSPRNNRRSDQLDLQLNVKQVPPQDRKSRSRIPISRNQRPKVVTDLRPDGPLKNKITGIKSMIPIRIRDDRRISSCGLSRSLPNLSEHRKFKHSCLYAQAPPPMTAEEYRYGHGLLEIMLVRNLRRSYSTREHRATYLRNRDTNDMLLASEPTTLAMMARQPIKRRPPTIRQGKNDPMQRRHTSLELLSSSEEPLSKLDDEAFPVSSLSRRHRGAAAEERDRRIKQLKHELKQIRHETREEEKRKTTLVEKVNDLNHTLQERKARSMERWHILFVEEKRRTAELEALCSHLRHKLAEIHTKINQTVRSWRDMTVGWGKEPPSRKLNHKISCIRLEHEIADLRRRIENMHLRLDVEMRLKQHAEDEIRHLRNKMSTNKRSISEMTGRRPIWASLTRGPPQYRKASSTESLVHDRRISSTAVTFPMWLSKSLPKLNQDTSPSKKNSVADSPSPTKIRRESSTTRKPSIIRDRESSITRNPSTIRGRESSITRKPPTIRDRESSITRKPTIRDRESSITRKPSTIRDRESSITRKPPTIRDREPSITRKPPSTTRRGSTTTQDSSITNKPPVTRQPPPQVTTVAKTAEDKNSD
ncbi:unnamed protein product [Cyprideis torosa]|uniref:Uncharacterized protein n=1 Tax=Cyprideis torosa TaxID=163714 RepID=A0A7R8WFU8_9CRUS|nr:unnamed protein product [Cyprideis torosa]CAG0891014.1 unnamed protein product [Cyprideis torosa]